MCVCFKYEVHAEFLENFPEDLEGARSLQYFENGHQELFL